MTTAPAGTRRSRPRSRVAVVIAHEDGRVLEMNRPARELLGDGASRREADLFAAGCGGRDLPCRDGCAASLVRGGVDAVVARRVALGGDQHDLVCVPLGERVISILLPVEAPREDLRLTAREVQVLRQLALGLTVPQAAAVLDISAATVRTHVEHMRRKLGAKTQAALVAHGYRAGYLP